MDFSYTVATQLVLQEITDSCGLIQVYIFLWWWCSIIWASYQNDWLQSVQASDVWIRKWVKLPAEFTLRWICFWATMVAKSPKLLFKELRLQDKPLPATKSAGSFAQWHFV